MTQTMGLCPLDPRSLPRRRRTSETALMVTLIYCRTPHYNGQAAVAANTYPYPPRHLLNAAWITESYLYWCYAPDPNRIYGVVTDTAP